VASAAEGGWDVITAGGCPGTGLGCLALTAKRDWDDFTGSALGGCLLGSVVSSDCKTTLQDAVPFLVAAISDGEADPLGGGLTPELPQPQKTVWCRWPRAILHPELGRCNRTDRINQNGESSAPMIEIADASPDENRPYANLLPIVNFLSSHGNVPTDGGFILNPDGWRCRFDKPLDLNAVRSSFRLPKNVTVSETHDSVLDTGSWCSIEGPGAHSS
jgi:hypothetical protein